MDEELELCDLGNADILELLCLQGDLKPIKGCDGPSLTVLDGPSSADPSDRLGLLQARWTHVVGAYARQRDDANHRLVNNAYAYIKEDLASRWPQLLRRSPRKPLPNWSCCLNGHDEAEGGDNDVCPTPRSHRKEKLSATISAIPNMHADKVDSHTCGFPTNDSPTAATSDLQTCPHCQESPFPLLRSLVSHGSTCPKTPDLARAKTLRVTDKTCLYHCGYSHPNYKQHENRSHYVGPLGQPITRFKSQSHELGQKIDPLQYFMYPPKLKGLVPDDILHTAFSSLPPLATRQLILLDDKALATKVRRALEKCQDHLVPSLEAQDSLGNTVAGDSTIPAPAPVNEPAHQIQPSPGLTAEDACCSSGRVDLLSTSKHGKMWSGRQLEPPSLICAEPQANTCRPTPGADSASWPHATLAYTEQGNCSQLSADNLVALCRTVSTGDDHTSTNDILETNDEQSTLPPSEYEVLRKVIGRVLEDSEEIVWPEFTISEAAPDSNENPEASPAISTAFVPGSANANKRKRESGSQSTRDMSCPFRR